MLRQVECAPYDAPPSLSIPAHLLFDLPRRSRNDAAVVQPFAVSVLPEVRSYFSRDAMRTLSWHGALSNDVVSRWADWFCDVWRCCMPQAVLVCDLHAHVALGGVLGFLAGTWNAAAGELCVRAAVPCLSSNTRACGVPDGFPSAQVVAEVGIRSRRLSG